MKPKNENQTQFTMRINTELLNKKGETNGRKNQTTRTR